MEGGVSGGLGARRRCVGGGEGCQCHNSMIMANFSMDALASDPGFDFVQTILDQHSTDDADLFTNDSPYNSADFSCVYLSEDQIIKKFKNHCKPSILSINIQSLHAKFIDFTA